MPETIPDGTMSLILLGISYSFIIPLLLFIIFKSALEPMRSRFFSVCWLTGPFLFAL